MKLVLTSFVTALVLCGSAASASAQTCFGNVAISSSAPLSVGVIADFFTGGRGVGGSLVGGSDRFFVEGGGGRGAYTDADGAWKYVFGSVGAQFAAEPGSRFQACPYLFLSQTYGPNYPPDETFKSTQIGIGGAVGFIALQSDSAQVVPSVSINFNTLKNKDVFQGVADTWTDHTASLGIGVGFVFNSRVSFQPVAFIPIDDNGGDVSYQLLARLSLGN